MGQSIFRFVLLSGFAAVIMVSALTTGLGGKEIRGYILLGGGLAVGAGLIGQLACRLVGQWFDNVPIWEFPPGAEPTSSTKAKKDEPVDEEDDDDDFYNELGYVDTNNAPTSADVFVVTLLMIYVFCVVYFNVVAYWCPPIMPIYWSVWANIENPHALATGLALWGMMAGVPLAAPIVWAARAGQRPRWTALGLLLPVLVTLLLWMVITSGTAFIAGYWANAHDWPLQENQFVLNDYRAQAYAVYYSSLTAAAACPVLLAILGLYVFRVRVNLDKSTSGN